MIATELSPDGSQLVFVNETSKDELTWAQHYGRAASGSCATLSDVFVRGDHYSLVAMITIDGYLAAEVVEGSYDGDSFYAYIADKLSNMNPFPAEQSILVLDNCCIHHNEDLTDLVRTAGM
ncbi:hypothetical protein PAXRUDRAFT_160246 [Paxillus rubicundulus Ve08.2h10]|uniref:Tc1-like transposase DDE domain-containing protein n=1 Tax=Paxillus rubicundulus Ve08.2h10 TaxID=930991 RepID=A0A0D0CWC7_9AGAM|nr:hypothetical protein PAXRUDRAFT_160246 [Paxillus rubicundulus Ve08.2h10]